MKRAFSLRGFTLIELLVVIAIISILSMVAFASFSEARMKARDTARTTDIHQLSAALKVYAATYGRYPSSTDGTCQHNNSFAVGGCLQVLVTAGLFTTLPTDPINEPYSGTWQNDNMYFYDNYCSTTGFSDQQYRLWTNGERNNEGLAKGWWYDNTIGMTNCNPL